jgi:hypothetical protein
MRVPDSNTVFIEVPDMDKFLEVSRKAYHSIVEGKTSLDKSYLSV